MLTVVVDVAGDEIKYCVAIPGGPHIMRVNTLILTCRIRDFVQQKWSTFACFCGLDANVHTPSLLICCEDKHCKFGVHEQGVHAPHIIIDDTVHIQLMRAID